MATQNGNGLFRQQVIDEVNTKLNGDVLLNPGASFRNWAIAVLLLTLCVFLFFNFFSFKTQRTVHGELIAGNHGSLEASFLLPVSLINQIQNNQPISVRLVELSKEKPIYTTIRVISIGNTLVVPGASYLGNERVAYVKATGEIADLTVSIEGKRVVLSEGVQFDFSLEDKKVNLLTWLKHYFFGTSTNEQY